MELQTMVQLERKLAAAFDTEFNWRNGTIVLHGVEVEFEVRVKDANQTEKNS